MANQSDSINQEIEVEKYIEQNKNEETKIAGIIPILSFNRLSSTPLKTSSSTRGARIIVPRASIKNATGVRLV